MYSSFSPQLARHLEYTVSDASRIALTGTLGMASAGPVAGWVVDRTGYSLPFICGGLSVSLGYWGLKHQYDSFYSSVFISASLLYVIGAGSTFTSFPSVKCCAVTFPKIKGLATSLPLATFGLSAMFFSTATSIFYPGDTSGVLGFISIVSFCIFLLCAPSIIACDLRQGSVLHHPTPVPSQPSSSSDYSHTYMHSATAKPKRLPASKGSGYDEIQDPLVAELSGKQLLSSKVFWTIFFITGSLAATGQMYIYSVGYISKALYTHLVFLLTNSAKSLVATLYTLENQIQASQQLQVGTISIANSLGRVFAGVLSDILVKSFRKSRALLLFLPCFAMIVAQLLGLKVSIPEHLYMNSILTGLSYGLTFGAMPVIVGETFGMKNFSSNWGLVSLAPIVPSFLLTTAFGIIYDSNTQRMADSDSGEIVSLCILGTRCYSFAFYLTFVVTLAGAGAVYLLILSKSRSNREGNDTSPIELDALAPFKTDKDPE